MKTSPDFPIRETMRAWVLGDPGERSEDAIKVVVKARGVPALQRQAAE